MNLLPSLLPMQEYNHEVHKNFIIVISYYEKINDINAITLTVHQLTLVNTRVRASIIKQFGV